jgi:hypothetical protein
MASFPIWTVAAYSPAILALPILGERLGEALRATYWLEVIETIPTLVCLIVVLRLPAPTRLQVPRAVRSRSVSCRCPCSCRGGNHPLPQGGTCPVTQLRPIGQARHP